ncbi:fimbrial protein [Escherichia coli]
MLFLICSSPVYALRCKNIQTGLEFDTGYQDFRLKLQSKNEVNSVNIIDLSQFIHCMNEDLNGNDYDYIKLRAGSTFSQKFNAKSYGFILDTSRGRSYNLPLTQDTVYYSIYQPRIWTALPWKISMYIEPGSFGRFIHKGDLVATIYGRKESTYGEDSGIRDFTWNFYADNDLYVNMGACSVSSNNIVVALPDYPSNPEPVNLSVKCDESMFVSYILSGKTENDSSIFSNMYSSGAKGVGIQILDPQGVPIKAGEKKELGYVGPYYQPLGIKAQYALFNTGEQPSAGKVQAFINITFEYR